MLYVFLILVLIPIWFVLRGLRGSILTKDVRTDDRVFFGRIRYDIMFEGETIAFRLDEVVDILGIEPQPEGKFKYVVHSKVVDGTFVLDEDEIEVRPRPGQ